MPRILFCTGVFCLALANLGCDHPHLDCASETAFLQSSAEMLEQLKNSSEQEQQAFIAGMAKLKIDMAISNDAEAAQRKCNGMTAEDLIAYGKTEQEASSSPTLP